MRFNFKKVSAVLSSAVMLGASVGMAAAANYPTPFVVSGTANVAIVYGTGAGVSTLDLIQSGNIQSNLQSFMSATGTSETTTSGEIKALFTSGTKLYINDSLNTVKSVLTDSDLPIVLKDTAFSGNVDSSIAHTIDIGGNPKITFAKQPTSSDDPNIALTLSTTQSNYIYNATATFSKAVNFSHADSEGEDITLFGMDFTVSSATDTDTIVLLQSAEKVSLTSDNPTAEVIIAGGSYTLELVSSSDSSATIAVTDSSGDTESKEINEAQSKTVNGITIAVTTADETNLKLSATIVAGSEKITLEDGSSVTVGDDDELIDGTLIDFETGNPNNITSLTISVYAPESDEDAIKPGGYFVDPVYKTFKIDFPGFNIDTESTDREDIKFTPNGDDKIDMTFTDHSGYTKTFQIAKNVSSSTLELMRDDNGRNISVFEAERFKDEDYIVVGNEDEGHLLRLTSVSNSSSTGSSNTNGDKAEFQDVFSGTTYSTTWTSDGVGTIVVGGKTYDVALEGKSGLSTEAYNVSLNYPDSSGAGVAVAYPTIQTGKGANLALYEPLTITLNNWDGDNSVTNLSEIKLPDGDGYTSISSIGRDGAGTMTSDRWNFTAGGTTYSINTSNSANRSFTVAAGQLKYNVSNYGTANSVRLRLLTVAETVEIIRPAVVIFQEKDDNNRYEALIVELEDGATSDDGLGIDSIEDTWSAAAAGWKSSRYTDSKQEDRANLWGSIITVDSSDSDQKSATISYPKEQIHAQLYVTEEAASITTGGSTTGVTALGEVLVKDSEVSSVSSKNLIIVGGSCINSAAAKVLGGSYCSADFTTATGVGTGEFLLKGVTGAYTTGKIALVVAGYEAADTVNAAKYLTTQTVDTSKEYKGTSATAATLVTTETTA